MRVLNPVSPLSGDIASFFNNMFALSCVIFGLVAVLLVLALLRYRARPGHTTPAIHASEHTFMEITWTAVPVAIVAVIFVFTVKGMYRTAPAELIRSPDVQITGHQWWWEVRYPNGAYTANEIHVPVGKRVNAWILGGDVIHDFWVPELGPKMDAVPGRTNSLWIEADRPGTYLGACAEYCGTEHAWMLIRVMAQPPADFAAWLAAQARPPAAPSAGDALRGSQLFRDRTCINCHAIAGTDATSRVGPDLSHIASRTTLGAGIMQNTSENLARWIADPQKIKGGVLMPNLQLSDDDVRAITAYMETLK
jgi:cytochrome c oxidase subunit II